MSSPHSGPTRRFLVSHALRHKEVTYLNVSAAPHTWPIIEAQGFSRYSEGIFVCLPALSRHAAAAKRSRCSTRRSSRRVGVDPFEQEILAATRRARLHQPVVRDVRARLSVRFPAAPGQRLHPLRATDLLPRHRGLRALCRTDRPLSRAARPSASSSSTPTARYRVLSASSAPAASRNISKARSGRGSATSPIPNTRYWACELFRH